MLWIAVVRDECSHLAEDLVELSEKSLTTHLVVKVVRNVELDPYGVNLVLPLENLDDLTRILLELKALSKAL